jgi:lysozyme family protein
LRQAHEVLRGLKTLPTFCKGWTSRVSGVRAQALKLAEPGAASLPGPVEIKKTAAVATTKPEPRMIEEHFPDHDAQRQGVA